MKLKFALFILGVALVVGFVFSTNSMTNSVMAATDGKVSFSSPAAQQNYQSYGDLNIDVKAEGYAETLKQPELKLKLIAQRSYGCSEGCSTGCSSGCSSGCSMGCSSGCSSGCSIGCSSGCRW